MKLFRQKKQITISSVPNAEAQFNSVCPTSSMKFTSNVPSKLKKKICEKNSNTVVR